VNLERLILKAKRLLHLDKQVETRQQQSVARLEKAWRQADEYKKANPLDAPEEAIFDAATFSHLRRYSGSDDYFEIALTTLAHDLLWHTDDYFESALAALRQFRVQQAEWRARPVKRVTIVPEVDWQPDWRQERRLALLFEPQIAESWGAAVIKQVWLPRWPNQLELIAQTSDFATEADTWRFNALDSIAITRCDELHQWRGSSFSIREGDDAREVAPQVYSPNTSVDASIPLSCITFDHLRERLEAAARETPETHRLLLACGFTGGNIAIPRPRSIGRNEKIRNPVGIEQDTPRIWFEIFRVAETESRTGSMQMESLERWMAVEA
jgi:hypothetical protein